MPLVVVLTRRRIVGKGNHSPHHVQKIKPRVEKVCRELGLQYATEENAGRIYVNLTGGAVDPSFIPHTGGHHAPHHQQQQQHHQQGGQGQDVAERVARWLLPRALRKLEKACCVVM